MLKEAVGCIKSDSSFFKIPEKNSRSTDSSSRTSNNTHEIRVADGAESKKPPNAVLPMLPDDVLLKNMDDFNKNDPIIKIASEPPVFKSTEDISSNAEALRMMAASFKESVKLETDINISATDINAKEMEANVQSGETERKVPRSKRHDDNPNLGPIPQS